MSCFVFMILLAVLDAVEVQAVRLDDIYWNTTNPIFRIDNTDHIIDVNKNNLPFEYDQVNIICPSFPSGTSEDDAEQYIIYNVSKEEYDSCRITNSNPRIIAICDKPTKVMYFTITFRSFTPQPGGLEFRPGQDYYFISTSNGKKSGLRSLVGGKCGTHNMKIIFKVCCDKKTKEIKHNRGRLPLGGIPVTSRRLPTTTRPHDNGQFIPPYRPSRPRVPKLPPRKLLPSTNRPHVPRYHRPQWPNNHEARDRWQPSIVPNDRGRSKYDPKKSSKGQRGRSPNDTRAKNDLLKNNRSSSVVASMSTLIISVTCLLYNSIFVS